MMIKDLRCEDMGKNCGDCPFHRYFDDVCYYKSSDDTLEEVLERVEKKLQRVRDELYMELEE